MDNDIFRMIIKYAGREYCVVPYDINDVCLCITENTIIGISLEEDYLLHTSQSIPQIRIQCREAFTQKVMSRKENLDKLDFAERKFFEQAFELALQMNQMIEKNSEFKLKRKILIDVIERGLIGRQYSNAELGQHLSMLAEKSYLIENNCIICNGKKTNIFDFCMDTFETFKEEKKMGLFDGFFNENRQSGKVISYVKNMSRERLISAIKKEYFNIKGTCNKVPQMGVYGSFEFTGALLLWKYAKENLNGSSRIALGHMMITLGDTIGCAFNGMPAGEWSDKIDVVINTTDDILSYSEWSDIYNYLKFNFEREIHAMEFNNGTYSEEQKNRNYRAFTITYNSMSDFNSVLEYYTKQGMNIKQQMPFRIEG